MSLSGGVAPEGISQASLTFGGRADVWGQSPPDLVLRSLVAGREKARSNVSSRAERAHKVNGQLSTATGRCEGLERFKPTEETRKNERDTRNGGNKIFHA